jgi:hypothetical protein
VDTEDNLEPPPAYTSVFRRGDERSPEEIAREIEDRYKYITLFLYLHFIIKKT